MGLLSDRPRGAAVAALIGVLLAAGVAEIVGAGLRLASDGVGAVTALGAPQALLPVTLAAVAAGSAGRGARIAAFFGAAGALIARVVSASLLVVPGWRIGTGDVLGVVAGLLTGVGLVGWTLHLVLHHRDLSDRDEAVGPPVTGSPQGAGPATARLRPRAETAIPGAGAEVDRAVPWATASTPWPRADENDPNGTLIRPPRR